MATNLPYLLREGQKAYAAKVMANFEALLGAYNMVHVDGLGESDVATLLQLLCQAAVMAGKEGNTAQIVFPDGDSLEEKFDAGTLNAALIDSDGLFYFEVDPNDGHLYVTASESIGPHDFYIDEHGHLIYNLSDPEESMAVHRYDLGLVRGERGPVGVGNMATSVYDPNNQQKDLNLYTGYFNCQALGWGGYHLTYDTVFQEGKTYYTEDGGDYTEAGVTEGDPVPVNTYYEKLPDEDCLLTDDDHISGATFAGHITAVSGHALVGPAADAMDEAKLAWSAGIITAAGQGNGSSASGALNASPWIRLRALGNVPAAGVPLMITFYL